MKLYDAFSATSACVLLIGSRELSNVMRSEGAKRISSTRAEKCVFYWARLLGRDVLQSELLQSVKQLSAVDVTAHSVFCLQFNFVA